VIKSFADAETREDLERPAKPAITLDIQPIALCKLRLLNQARTLTDLRVPPGNRLDVLKGERRGQYSNRINRQWRICFRWQEGAAQGVAIVDYHD
jgi:proteic killer suppression protein